MCEKDPDRNWYKFQDQDPNTVYLDPQHRKYCNYKKIETSIFFFLTFKNLGKIEIIVCKPSRDTKNQA